MQVYDVVSRVKSAVLFLCQWLEISFVSLNFRFLVFILIFVLLFLESKQSYSTVCHCSLAVNHQTLLERLHISMAVAEN